MAGSESVLRILCKAFVEAGHETTLWVTDCGRESKMRPITYEGTHLVPVRNVLEGCTRLRRWKPDVAVSHHQHSAMTTKVARSMGIPAVFLSHNQMDINKTPLRYQPDLVIHNSDWVRESLNRKFDIVGQQTVIRPPLDCGRHTVPNTGDAVTLINVNEHKGARFFYKLAERMHDTQFIAVLGGHGNQIRPPRGLSNVELVQSSPDLKPVWAQTGLLLMPSIQESYGLVGIEAGCSGIPTLANVTPGLKESLGPAGLFVSWASENLPKETEDYWDEGPWRKEWAEPSTPHLNEWETGIRDILHPDHYQKHSDASRGNSATKCAETQTDMARFVDLLVDLPNHPRTKPKPTQGLITTRPNKSRP